MASTAAANPPDRSVTFELNPPDFDFLAGSGLAVRVPVARLLGTPKLTTTTFFDPATGNPIRVVTHLDFAGS